MRRGADCKGIHCKKVKKGTGQFSIGDVVKLKKMCIRDRRGDEKYHRSAGEGGDGEGHR